MKTGKTVKVLLTAATAAGMLAGCGSKTDTDTFRIRYPGYGFYSS